ncbi:PEP-CTERM sorting domain-containing protein [Akkermansiaceae bacterium]|nr:PEP-CTERM sorting domain-containing protein [Akkermansiaceae bacterium]
MKLHHKFALLIFAPALLTPMSSAATVIIDGTAPGYTNNGSFETTTGWQGNETTVTNLGTNLGITRNVQYRTANGTPTDGITYAVIGQNTASATGVMGIFLNTGYDLVLGDTFNLSFWHGSHSAASSGLSINWQLFTSTTGTETGVVQDVVAFGFVSGSATNVQEIQAGIGSVTGASAGKRLFLSFTPSGSNGQFAMLDEINLTVIPEPSSAGLLGLAGTCLLLRRRRASLVPE